MRILVTGAHGFVGRHLRAELERAGEKWLPFTGDVRQPLGDLPEADAVVHLAAVTSSRAFADDPEPAFETNVLGTLRVLEHCRRRGCRLVFASSSAVHALRASPPHRARAPVAPPSPYAASKAAAEQLCRAYADGFGVDVAVLRPFNVYGPGQSESFLVPYLVARIRAGDAVRLRTPESRRDLVHVRDVARALALAARRAAPGHRVLDVGTGVATRVRDVAMLVGELAGVEPRIECDAGGADPNPISIADVGRVRDELGWSPRVALRDGLRELVAARSG